MICSRRDPEAKGLVERANGYLETLVPARPDVHRPGRLQHPARGVAGRGEHAGTAGRWAAPRPTGSAPTGPRCCALPPVAAGDRVADLDPAAAGPLRPRWTATTTRCTRRWSAGGSRSSPTWTGSGCSATGRWSPTTTGCWARHQTITDPAHRRPPPRRCAATAPASTVPRRRRGEVEIRDLADYDTALRHRSDRRPTDGGVMAATTKHDHRPGRGQPSWRS